MTPRDPTSPSLKRVIARQGVRKSGGAGGGGKARVVVCGGGYAGCMVAAELCADAANYHVVLVDPKEYFEDVTANPRGMVDPGDTYGGDVRARAQRKGAPSPLAGLASAAHSPDVSSAFRGLSGGRVSPAFGLPLVS